MHDNQIEERLRTVLRGEGDALPLTITPDELERRLAFRRRERVGRRAGLVAAAVVVVAIGSLVVSTSGWFRSPSVGSGPTAVPTANPASPSAAALDCETVDPNKDPLPPTLAMGLSPGDSIGYAGVRGSFLWGDTIIEAYQSVDPQTLDPIRVGPPSKRLGVLASSSYACLVAVDAVATPVDGAGSPVQLMATAVDPTRDVEFPLPPTGEWLVKVRADFGTTPPGHGWSETTFRVVVYDPSADWVTDSLPSLDAPEGTVLLEGRTGSDRPGPLIDEIGETIVGQVPPRSTYRVDFVCIGYAPMRWSIGKPVGNEFGFLSAGVQTCDGAIGTQIIASGTPQSDLDVIVEGDPAAVWRIAVSTESDEPAILAPALRMWATDNPDGARVASEAFAHCAATDDAISDACGPSWSTLDDRLGVLVPASDNVTFALQDGWQVDAARVVAVAREAVQSGANAPEYSVAFIDTSGLEQTIPMALEPGEWIVQVSINATKDDVHFGAEYYLRLFVTQ